MSKRRVVVTGLGMLSPVGNTAESSWQALLQGHKAITIWHNGASYRLQATRLGKLILTK